MKLTLEGDVLWERTWGGDGYEQAISVALAEDGGAYVFGETDSDGSGDLSWPKTVVRRGICWSSRITRK